MTFNNRQNKEQGKWYGNLRSVSIYLVVFSISFVLFHLPISVDASCTTGDSGKWSAYGKITESGDRWGAEGKLIAKYFNICGTTNNVSYAHVAVAMLQSTDGANYVEGGIWKGYGAGYTATSPKYMMISQNTVPGAGYQFVDVSASSGAYPAINDNVKFTVYWDYNSGFPYFRDYYKVIIDNPGKHTVTVSNIWSNGKGKFGIAQEEILSRNQDMKSEANTLKDYSTSQTWSAWTSSSGFQTATATPYEICYIKDAQDKYRFGLQATPCDV
jgi:hypothetical protein